MADLLYRFVECAPQEEVSMLQQLLAEKEKELKKLQDTFANTAARLDRVVNVLKK